MYDCIDHCSAPVLGSAWYLHAWITFVSTVSTLPPQIALYEATGERLHLTRATEIAHKLCVSLPNSAGCNGKVVEHYTSEWKPDPEKNKDVDPASEEYIFRPFGFQPGHSFEWVKLIVMIERLHTAAGSSEDERGWMVPTAELLFKTACECGWDSDRGGLCCELPATLPTSTLGCLHTRLLC